MEGPAIVEPEEQMLATRHHFDHRLPGEGGRGEGRPTEIARRDHLPGQAVVQSPRGQPDRVALRHQWDSDRSRQPDGVWRKPAPCMA